MHKDRGEGYGCDAQPVKVVTVESIFFFQQETAYEVA